MKRQLSLNPTTREVKIFFVLHLIGISLVSCGRLTLLSFQTSFYVENGLGAIGLTVLFSLTLVSALVGPTFLKMFSLKIGLIFFDLSALVYCAANFYPEVYTIIPASVVSGVGTAVFWISSGSFNVYFAKLFKKCGSKSLESYNNKCGGYLFSAITASQVIGNVITYVAFQSGVPIIPDDIANVTTQTSNFSGTLSPITSITRYAVSDVCGAKDCQDSRVTEQNLSSYVPPNQITLYIVLSVFTAFCLVGMLMHSLFAPSGFILDQAKSNNDSCEQAHCDEVFSDKTLPNVPFKVDVNSNHGAKQKAEKNEEKSQAKTTNLQTVQTEFILTLRHFIKPDQLLLTGLQFHIGLVRSFLVSEMTRSYVSCVHGVSEVGICLAIFNATGFIVSMINGKVCEKFGRKYPIIFAFICNAATYVFCLLWIPSESSSKWIVYGLYFVSGISNPIFATTTVAAVASFYPDSSSRGFTCWTVITTSSGMIQNAWSTSLCVNYKIYVLMAVLCFAVFTHLVAEHRHSRTSPPDKSTDSTRHEECDQQARGSSGWWEQRSRRDSALSVYL